MPKQLTLFTDSENRLHLSPTEYHYMKTVEDLLRIKKRDFYGMLVTFGFVLIKIDDIDKPISKFFLLYIIY